MSDTSQLIVKVSAVNSASRITVVVGSKLIQAGASADTVSPQITFDGVDTSRSNFISAMGNIELRGFSTLTIKNCTLQRPLVGGVQGSSNIQLVDQSSLTMQNMVAIQNQNRGVLSDIFAFNNSTIVCDTITYEIGSLAMGDSSYLDTYRRGAITGPSTIEQIHLAQQASADIFRVTAPSDFTLTLSNGTWGTFTYPGNPITMDCRYNIAIDALDARKKANPNLFSFWIHASTAQPTNIGPQLI